MGVFRDTADPSATVSSPSPVSTGHSARGGRGTAAPGRREQKEHPPAVNDVRVMPTHVR
jgi:hypothetical protein